MHELMYIVVEAFYRKAVYDVLIGYHFEKFRDPVYLEEHLKRIATFWEMQLSGKTSQKLENDQLTSAAPKRKRKPAPPTEEVKTDLAATAANPAVDEKTAVADKETSASVETAATAAEETLPVESINILDKSAAEPPSVPAEEPVTTPVADTSNTSSVGESNLDQRLDQLIDNVEKKEDPVATTPSMEDKIVQEEAYIAPPAYNLLGRGLVYNCKDKYWACIDKPSYVACNKNLKWHTAKGNAKECVVQNVYSSEEDCIKVQKYNVSVNQATSFCQ